MNKFLVVISFVLCLSLFKANIEGADGITVSKDGKELVVEGKLETATPQKLAAIILKSPKIRSVIVKWDIARPKTSHTAEDYKKYCDLFVKGVAGKGSQVESLKISINDSCYSINCFNWLAGLFPKVKNLDLSFASTLDARFSKFDCINKKIVCSFPELNSLTLARNGATHWVLEELLTGTPKLKKLHLTKHSSVAEPFLPDQKFVALLTKCVPRIEECAVYDHGVIDSEETVSMNKYPKAITPSSALFSDWSRLTSLRVVHFGTFNKCNGQYLTLLKLPQLQQLSIQGVDAISLQDIFSLLKQSPGCQTLSIGGCRHHRHSKDIWGSTVTYEYAFDPQYCRIAKQIKGEGYSEKLTHLKIEFASNTNFTTLSQLIKGFPNLQTLEFQNCPEVTKEVSDQLKLAHPQLKVVINPSLPVGVYKSGQYVNDPND